MNTTTLPQRYAASSVHAVLDLLDDPVLLLCRDRRLAFVNRAATALLGCESGGSLASLEPLVGRALTEWLAALPHAATRPAGWIGWRGGGATTPLPDAMTAPGAVLAGGRSAQVAVQPIDARCWAITLRVGMVPAPAADAVPRASAETLRLLWESPLPALLHDQRWRVIDANDAALAVVGCTREQLLGTDPVDLLDLAERVPYEAARRDCAERAARGLPPDPSPPPIESMLVDADGRERWFRVAHRRLGGQDGEPLTLVTFEDVTAVHEARRFDDWFDRTPAGMVLFDDDGSVVRANRAFGALVGKLPRRLDDADDAVQKLLLWTPRAAASALPEGAGGVERESWLPQPDGSARRLRTTVHGHHTERGRRGYFAMIEDRSAEEALDLARLQVGVLMGSAGAALATIPESAGWQPPAEGPDAAAPAGGPSPALSQGIRRQLVAAESLPAFDDMQLALREGRRAEARYQIRHPEFGSRWLLTRVEPARLESGRRTLSVVTLDITEQHEAQRRNEQLLREMTTILESTSAGMAYVRGGVLMRCNRRFEHMLGLQPEQGIGQDVAGLLTDWPRAQRIVADTLRSLATVNVYETEFEGRLRAGSAQHPRWFSLSVRRTDARMPGRAAHAGIEAIAVLSDVTRLKSQQRELEALVRDRELMFSMLDVGIAFVRGERIQHANEALAALLGCGVETLAGLAHRELYADAEAYDAQRAEEHGALLAHGRWSGGRRMRRRDGSLLWVHVSERLVVRGDLNGMIVSYADVDARYRAEHSLALQGERTRTILDSVLIGIVTVGDHGIEWMNRSAQRMFGATLADFVGQPMTTVATPEAGHPFRRSGGLAGLVEGQAETFECRLQARDGRAFWVAGNVVATDRESTGRQLTYALLDIERRRAAEDEVQRLIEIAPLAMTVYDAATQRVVRLNPMAASIVGCMPNDARDRTLGDLYPPDLAASMSADMHAALAEGAEVRRDYVFRIDGEERIFDSRYLPMVSVGAPRQLLLMATDVTEQRAAQEARYAAAVAQREMLIKEVHHRIKNNLQGVAGLLQDIALRQPGVAPAINEAVGQLQAIAQVYGLQVGSAGPLALTGVVEAVSRSVQRIFGRRIALTIDADAARWLLPEAESIPIALSVNELLTNAIKHSRPPAAAPRATASEAADAPRDVSCSVRSDAGGVWIVIGNDGRLPEGFSLAGFPGGVSGLGLVRALLPRRSSRLDIEQSGARVAATLHLTPPGVVCMPPA